MGSAPATPVAKGRTLCSAGERPLFACPIGRKLVSVCSNGKAATYRFGQLGRVELSSNKLAFADAMYSGGGETQISFMNNGFNYIVFDRGVRQMVRGELGGTAFSAGVLVRKNGRTVSKSECADDATISSAAEKLLPMGKFFYHE